MSSQQPIPSQVKSVRESIDAVKRIADGVVLVSQAMKELKDGPLNEKGLLVLLSNATGMSQAAVKKVLAGLSQLEEMYLQPEKKGK